MDFLETVNETPLDIDLMKRLLTFVDEMSDEQRSDMTGRSVGLIRFLEEEGIGSDPEMTRAYTLMAFEFRMEALSRLRDRPEYQAWSLQLGKAAGDPDDQRGARRDGSRAPAYSRKRAPGLEPEAFFASALLRTDVEGRG
ncbi:MAG: hypothetical protein JWQ89_2059 [Devosia sp.]|uniref:hypothetical protein n=1 Tax=Devosia sp. TaxID=1871048 RepID=UPI002617F2A7|nr:hypothetical protein [Devosia sp.]MDB5540332.1 hypothetical protein [Devosia sp.]